MTSAFHLEADIQVFPGTKADLTAEVASNSGLTTREAHYSATPYPWVAGDITVCPSEHPKDLLLAFSGNSSGRVSSGFCLRPCA